MGRPKGSKNKPKDGEEIVSDDDLLSTETIVTVDEDVVATIEPKKEKTFVGFHPITGAEVWI